MYRFFLAMAAFFNGASVGMRLAHLVTPDPDWQAHWSRVFIGASVAFFFSLLIATDDRS